MEVSGLEHQLFFDIMSGKDVLQVDPFLLAFYHFLHYFLSQKDLVVEFLCSVSELGYVPVRKQIAHGGHGLIQLGSQLLDFINDNDLTCFFELLEFDLEGTPLCFEVVELASQVEALGSSCGNVGDFFLRLLEGELEEDLKSEFLVVFEFFLSC